MDTPIPAGSTVAPFVVVGVNGSSSDPYAVRYAVEESIRTGADVRLLHVSPAWIPVASGQVIVPLGLQTLGHRILADAAAIAQVWAPDCHLTQELLSGPRDDTLLAHAEGAQTIVLGQGHRSLLSRVFTGDMTVAIAARTTGSVVCVPAAEAPSRPHGRVLAGVKQAAGAERLVERAFEAAAQRGAELVLLHAWKLPDAYDDLIESRVATEAWVSNARESLEPLVQRGRRARPDVPVTVEVVHAQAAWALVDASASADLVMLQRRSDRHPAAFQLGGTARAVLRDSLCPVDVSAPGLTRLSTDGLTLERAGAMQR